MTGDNQTRPIFVVGYQRSGTTLLQALLGAHPAIVAPPEMHYFNRITGLRDFYGDLRDDDRLRLALHDTINLPRDLLASCEFDEERLFARLAAGERTYSNLLDVVLMDLAERRGKRRWTEKTPEQRIGPILHRFPQAQIVHIVRDPRGAVASALRAPYQSRTAGQLARNWRIFEGSTRAQASKLDGTQYHRLRYEDLVSDAESAVRRVCEFLGEEFDAQMLSSEEREAASSSTVMGGWQAGALQTITATRADAWRDELTWRQLAHVEAETADLLRADGYEPPPRGRLVVGRVLSRIDVLGRRRERRAERSYYAAETPDDRRRHVMQQIEDSLSRAHGS